MKILAAIFLLLLAYCSISIATIIKNGVSLNSEPGMVARLKIFLSTHKAETANNASFNELRTPIYQASVDQALEAIKLVAEKKGWVVEPTASKSALKPNTLHYVVTTKLLRFKDDIKISTEAINTNQVAIHVTSESRVGKADFGANLSHIIQLINELDTRLTR